MRTAIAVTLVLAIGCGKPGEKEAQSMKSVVHPNGLASYSIPVEWETLPNDDGSVQYYPSEAIVALRVNIVGYDTDQERTAESLLATVAGTGSAMANGKTANGDPWINKVEAGGADVHETWYVVWASGKEFRIAYFTLSMFGDPATDSRINSEREKVLKMIDSLKFDP